MQMIDYVTMMLINMTGALVILSLFLLKGLDEKDRENWAPAFAICGLVAVVCGFVMTFTAPLPKPYNTAYGEMSVFFGVLFLGAAWTLAKGWNLLPLSIYAFFAGSVAMLLGVRIIHLSLTQVPLLSGVGFILTGLGGVMSGLVLWQHKIKLLRILGALAMLAAAAIWALTGYMAYWMHLLPPTSP
jgi:putative membrane protein